jgi:hypothetical protein
MRPWEDLSLRPMVYGMSLASDEPLDVRKRNKYINKDSKMGIISTKSYFI